MGKKHPNCYDNLLDRTHVIGWIKKNHHPPKQSRSIFLKGSYDSQPIQNTCASWHNGGFKSRKSIHTQTNVLSGWLNDDAQPKSMGPPKYKFTCAARPCCKQNPRAAKWKKLGEGSIILLWKLEKILNQKTIYLFGNWRKRFTKITSLFFQYK